jgi:hypothetical protein
MRIGTKLLALGAAALAGCGDSGDAPPAGPRFSGAVGTAWEAAAPSPEGFCPGFSDYSPPNASFHSLVRTGPGPFSTATLRFDPEAAPSGAWTARASAPDAADLGCFAGAARVGGSLFVMRNDQVYEYAIAADSWTIPVTSTVGATADAQTTHDDAGRVYAVETDPPHRVIRYDPATGAVTKLESGGFGGTFAQPRIAWDPPTRRLFVGPAFNSPQLWSFDPESPGTAQRRADVPAYGGGGGTGMGDAFCGDRSGHLYATGDTGGAGSPSVFQYDTGSNTWRAVPDLPEDHGANGSCTVTHDGWLYLTPGDTANVYRLRLL